jgi:hypothetical protein
VDATAGGSQQSEAGRVIHARLTVRGFEDSDRRDVDRYAGASSRCPQKFLVSEAIERGRDIAATDVSKALLRGVAYEELAELTGEKPREVNFYLPASNIPLLQKVPGFGNFNPTREVRHCDKLCAGLVDAPRAFSLKLSKVTRDECKMAPSDVDPELCFRREEGRLVCLMTKHVDDLEISGEPKYVHLVLEELQNVFGGLKLTWNAFAHCGG